MAVERQPRMILIGQITGLEVRKEHCCGTERNGKSIGIVGMGNIGTAVARIFRGAFNASVYACDPRALEGAWSDMPHTRVNNLEEMLPYVDILILYVPLNSKTSGVVDEDTLVKTLEKDFIFSAGLDCHEEEPLTLGKYERLWATRKVVSTPHIGAMTAETQIQTATAATDNVFKFLNLS
jgi:phosphoglycerate dehydrogenase-like enzyme